MKIKQNDQIINTRTAKNALRLDDLTPGDVFRFLRGKPENIYIMSEYGAHFHINGNREYLEDDSGSNPPVVLYPEAILDLGPEQFLKDEDE